ncbi:MAG: DUF4258 domain-containing protein [Candidatus Caldatribacteriaceae bacterium]
MEFCTGEIAFYARGKLYSVSIQGKEIRILFLYHVLERIKKWSLAEEQVLETLLCPEEVLRGHGGRYIAQRRYKGSHLVRAIYEYDGNIPVLVTVYFPHAERYFQGGKVFEDKIFKRS